MTLDYCVRLQVLSLEGRRPGASKVVLQDPDTVSILDMVKEKLQGQMLAGLLTGNKIINCFFFVNENFLSF